MADQSQIPGLKNCKGRNSIRADRDLPFCDAPLVRCDLRLGGRLTKAGKATSPKYTRAAQNKLVKGLFYALSSVPLLRDISNCSRITVLEKRLSVTVMAVQTAMLLATVALPIAIYLFKILSVAFEKDLKSLPGPWLSRFTNIPLKLALLSGQKAMYIHRLHQKYGPVVRVAPTEVSFADIEVQQQIHRIGTPFRKAEWYQKGSPAQSSDETAAVFGLRDHKQAQARRRLFQRAGTKAIVVQWEPRIVEIVNQAVHRIKSAAERGTVDMFKWWQFMATDIVGEIAFGKNLR